MTVAVDTNVGVAANDRDAKQASPGCVIECVRRLQRLMRDDAVAIDDQWLIIREYQGNLRSSGQPGVGDAFLKWVLSNQRNPGRCHRSAYADSYPGSGTGS